MIHPVILSGGSGTRLWPMSRTLYPKQILPLVGDSSLLQQAAQAWRDRRALKAHNQQLAHLGSQRGSSPSHHHVVTHLLLDLPLQFCQ